MLQLVPIAAAGVITDSLGRDWDPQKHPRDRKGKFIHTFRRIRAFLTPDGTDAWATGEVAQVNIDGSIRMKVTHVADDSNKHYIGQMVDVKTDSVENINEKATLTNPGVPYTGVFEKWDESGMDDFFQKSGFSTDPNQAPNELTRAKAAFANLKSGKVHLATNRDRYHLALYMRSQSGEGKPNTDGDFMQALEAMGADPAVIDDTPDGLSGVKGFLDTENAGRSPQQDDKDSIEWFNEELPTDPDIVRAARLRDSDVRVYWHDDGSQSVVYPNGTSKQHDKNKGSLLLAAWDAHEQEGTGPEEPPEGFEAEPSLKAQTQVGITETDDATPISEEEQEAYDYYIGAGYDTINTDLRNELPLSAYDADAVMMMDGVQERSVLKEDVVLYRGMGGGGPVAAELKKYVEDIEIGSETQDLAFMSTSVDEEVAQQFMVGSFSAIFVIKAKKGQRAVDLGGLGFSINDEQEILLPRGSTLKALGKVQTDDNSWRVYAELVQDDQFPDFEVSPSEEEKPVAQLPSDEELPEDYVPDIEPSDEVVPDVDYTDISGDGIRDLGMTIDNSDSEYSAEHAAAMNGIATSLETGAITPDEGHKQLTGIANDLYDESDEHEGDTEGPLWKLGNQVADLANALVGFEEEEEEEEVDVTSAGDDDMDWLKLPPDDPEDLDGPLVAPEDDTPGDEEWTAKFTALQGGPPTQVELEALYKYQGTKHKKINRWLRGDTEGMTTGETKEIEEIVTSLDGLMERSSLRDDVKVYRGMKAPKEGMTPEYQAFIDSLVEGEELEDDGYMSTSRYKVTANAFSEAPPWAPQKQLDAPTVLFEINLPEGHQGLDVDGLVPGGPGETEILLPRGSKISITEVYKDEYNKYNVTATIIPDEGFEDGEQEEAPTDIADGGGEEEGQGLEGPPDLDTGPGAGDAPEEEEEVAPPLPEQSPENMWNEDSEWEKTEPLPEVLYHVTTPENAKIIDEQGLVPGEEIGTKGARVHMSEIHGAEFIEGLLEMQPGTAVVYKVDARDIKGVRGHDNDEHWTANQVIPTTRLEKIPNTVIEDKAKAEAELEEQVKDADRVKVTSGPNAGKEGSIAQVWDNGNIQVKIDGKEGLITLAPDWVEHLPKEETTAGPSPFQVLDDPGTSGDGYYPSNDGSKLWGKYGAAGVMVRHVDEDGTERFLMVQRGPIVSTNKGKWQLPGGALNSNEDDYQGTARELNEELQSPEGWLDGLEMTGEVNFEHPSGWHYNNIAATSPEMFEPTVDGTETGDAKWFTKDEIAELPLHPALAKNLDAIFETFDSEPDLEAQVNEDDNFNPLEDGFDPLPEFSPTGDGSDVQKAFGPYVGKQVMLQTSDEIMKDFPGAEKVRGPFTVKGFNTGHVLMTDANGEDKWHYPGSFKAVQLAGDEDGIPDASAWQKQSGQKGSNPGGMFVAPDGSLHYVKASKTPHHAKNEALAAAFYHEAGIDAAEQNLVHTPWDKLGTESPVISGAKMDLKSHLNDQEYLDKVYEGFAVDAWLANWDVAGLVFDNMVTDADGNPRRIDPGGALWFRAQGENKGGAFGNNVSELDTFHHMGTAGQLFGKITPEQEKASAQRVVDITPEKIDELVDMMNFGEDDPMSMGSYYKPVDPEVMKATLKARRKFIADHYGLDLPEEHGSDLPEWNPDETIGEPDEEVIPTAATKGVGGPNDFINDIDGVSKIGTMPPETKEFLTQLLDDVKASDFDPEEIRSELKQHAAWLEDEWYENGDEKFLTASNLMGEIAEDLDNGTYGPAVEWHEIEGNVKPANVDPWGIPASEPSPEPVPETKVTPQDFNPASIYEIEIDGDDFKLDWDESPYDHLTAWPSIEIVDEESSPPEPDVGFPGQHSFLLKGTGEELQDFYNGLDGKDEGDFFNEIQLMEEADVTPEPEPAPAVPDWQDMHDEQGEYRVMPDGGKIRIGMKVKSTTDGLEGTIHKFEKNNDGAVVLGTDNKKRGRKIKTLQVQGETPEVEEEEEVEAEFIPDNGETGHDGWVKKGGLWYTKSGAKVGGKIATPDNVNQKQVEKQYQDSLESDDDELADWEKELLGGDAETPEPEPEPESATETPTFDTVPTLPQNYPPLPDDVLEVRTWGHMYVAKYSDGSVWMHEGGVPPFQPGGGQDWNNYIANSSLLYKADAEPIPDLTPAQNHEALSAEIADVYDSQYQIGEQINKIQANFADGKLTPSDAAQQVDEIIQEIKSEYGVEADDDNGQHSGVLDSLTELSDAYFALKDDSTIAPTEPPLAEWEKELLGHNKYVNSVSEEEISENVHAFAADVVNGDVPVGYTMKLSPAGFEFRYEIDGQGVKTVTLRDSSNGAIHGAWDADKIDGPKLLEALWATEPDYIEEPAGPDIPALESMRSEIPFKTNEVATKYNLGSYGAQQLRNIGFAMDDVKKAEPGSYEWSKGVDRVNFLFSKFLGQDSFKVAPVKNKWDAWLNGEKPPDVTPNPDAPNDYPEGTKVTMSSGVVWTKLTDGSWNSDTGTVVTSTSNKTAYQVLQKKAKDQHGEPGASNGPSLPEGFAQPPADAVAMYKPNNEANDPYFVVHADGSAHWYYPEGGVDDSQLSEENFESDQFYQKVWPPAGGTSTGVPGGTNVTYSGVNFTKTADGNWTSEAGNTFAKDGLLAKQLEELAGNAPSDPLPQGWTGPEAPSHVSFGDPHDIDSSNVWHSEKYDGQKATYTKDPATGQWIVKHGENGIPKPVSEELVDGKVNSNGDYKAWPDSDADPSVAPPNAMFGDKSHDVTTADMWYLESKDGMQYRYKKHPDGHWTEENLQSGTEYPINAEAIQSVITSDYYKAWPVGAQTPAPAALLPDDFVMPPPGSTVIAEYVGGDSVAVYAVQHPDGELYYYYSKKNSNITDKVYKPGLSVEQLKQYPTVWKLLDGESIPPATSTPTPAKTGPHMLGADNKPIYVGDKVQSTTDGSTGTVVKFESNGTGMVIMGDDGKKRARKALKLKSLEANAQPVPQSAPTPTPTPPTPKPKPKLISKKHDPDPNSPWFEQEKPTPPALPAAEDVQYVDDTWMQKADANYKLRMKSKNAGWTEKNLTESSTHGDYVAVQNGSMAKLDDLLKRGRITQELYDDAKAQIDKNAAPLLKKQAAYQAMYDGWLKDVKDWRIANGMPSIELRGMDSNVNKWSNSEAKAWMNQNQKPGTLGPGGVLSANAKQGVSSQKSSGQSGNYKHGLRALREKSLDENELMKLGNYKTIKNLEQAMDETAPVQEDFITIRTFSTDAFINPDTGQPFSSHETSAISKAVGTIQHDWGFAETAPGSLEKGATSGLNVGGGNNIRMELRVPAGTRGIWTLHPSYHWGFTHERGFILERGIAYYIHSAEFKGGYWHVKAEIIPKDQVNYDEFGHFVNENPFFD